LKAHTRDKLASRLNYYQDLGITAFYLNRTPANCQAARPVATHPGPAVAPSARPSQTLSPALSRPQVVAAPSSPSLFDAVNRIAGDTLERIRTDIGDDCRRCKLCEQRHTIVFGDGSPRAQLVFVGEGPGADEDAQGLPFVGRAGKLLTQMIEAMGLQRRDVYICNVVKCRPPENRLPQPDEIEQCSPFLLRQIAVLQPKVVVSLGACAMRTLLGITEGITKVHGQWFDWQGTRLMPIYHPAYLLRDPNKKPEAWQDLQKVMAYLGLRLPPKK
jgi:DNA polymerase